MAFKIELSPRASRDINEIVARIHADAPMNAERWQGGLEKKLLLLTQSAKSYGFAPENQDASKAVRQLMFGRCRILYTIEDGTAYVLTVRHGARQFMAGPETDRL